MSLVKTFEACYPHLPVWAQNVSISLYGLTYRQERLGGSFNEYQRSFEERDRWPAAKMGEYLNETLRGTLLHAFDHVPYYRRKWGEANIRRDDLLHFTVKDLAAFPITPKADLRKDSEEFVAQDIPAKQLHRYYSSGSTGTPVTCICTASAHRQFVAAREARSFGWAGTSIRHRRSMLGGRKVVPLGDARPPFHRMNWAEDQIYFSAFHISARNVRHYVDALNRFQPRLMTGYAHSHYLLARLILEEGLHLDFRPEALVLSSEKLTLEMKTVLQKAFGARAFEEYGSVENCILATECEQGRLHVNPDFGILEIVDDQGLPVKKGETGRIIVTALLNPAQPLIRYEIGDRGAWATQSCACGRDHLPVLEEVVGRIEDTIIAPDGRETVRFHWLFLGVPHVLEGQIIQETIQRIRLRIVPAGDFSEQDASLLRKRITDHLGNVEVVVETTSELPRTERGKFRAVVSLLPKEGLRDPHQLGPKVI